ncbi:MAG: hypothetical protein WDN69_16290 [Aliidongia sp.]
MVPPPVLTPTGLGRAGPGIGRGAAGLRRRREDEDGAVAAPSGGRPQVSQKPSSTVPRHEGHLQFAPLIALSFPTSILSRLPAASGRPLKNDPDRR